MRYDHTTALQPELQNKTLSLFKNFFKCFTFFLVCVLLIVQAQTLFPKQRNQKTEGQCMFPQASYSGLSRKIEPVFCKTQCYIYVYGIIDI